MKQLKLMFLLIAMGNFIETSAKNNVGPNALPILTGGRVNPPVAATPVVVTPVISAAIPVAAPKELPTAKTVPSKNYAEMLQKVKKAVTNAVLSGAELHDESEFNDQPVNQAVTQDQKLVIFTNIGSQFESFKDRVFKFEKNLKILDQSYAQVEKNLQKVNIMYKNFSDLVSRLIVNVESATTIDEYAKKGLISSLENLKNQVKIVQQRIDNNIITFTNILAYLTSFLLPLFDDKLNASVNGFSQGLNMSQELATEIQNFLVPSYKILSQEYDRISKAFEDAKEAAKPWYRKLF